MYSLIKFKMILSGTTLGRFHQHFAQSFFTRTDPTVNFINFFCAHYSYKCHFSSFFLRMYIKKLLKRHSYEKMRPPLTLMKLTTNSANKMTVWFDFFALSLGSAFIKDVRKMLMKLLMLITAEFNFTTGVYILTIFSPLFLLKSNLFLN